MSLYDRYKTNKTLEDEGAWMDLGDGIRFKIRRYKSKVVQDLKKKSERPYENIIKRGEDLPEDIAVKVLREQVGAGVIVDWEGVEGPDGKAIPYTAENARKLLEDLPDLMMELFNESLSRDRFKNRTDEEVGKN